MLHARLGGEIISPRSGVVKCINVRDGTKLRYVLRLLREQWSRRRQVKCAQLALEARPIGVGSAIGVDHGGGNSHQSLGFESGFLCLFWSGTNILLTRGRRYSNAEVSVEGAVASDIHSSTILAWVAASTTDFPFSTGQAPLSIGLSAFCH